jgi:hypothetical protein
MLPQPDPRGARHRTLDTSIERDSKSTIRAVSHPKTNRATSLPQTEACEWPTTPLAVPSVPRGDRRASTPVSLREPRRRAPQYCSRRSRVRERHAAIAPPRQRARPACRLRSPRRNRPPRPPRGPVIDAHRGKDGERERPSRHERPPCLPNTNVVSAPTRCRATTASLREAPCPSMGRPRCF